MLELIQSDVEKSLKVYYEHTFAPLSFSQKLYSIFAQPDANEREKQYSLATWMHAIGDDLAAKRWKSIAMIFNIEVGGSGPNHWIAVIADVERKAILYGDPLGKAPPQALVVALQNWTAALTKTAFSVDNLPSPKQNDGHSCGILAVMAIGHYYLPRKYPIAETLNCDEKRLQILDQLLMWHSKYVCNLFL